MNILEQKALTRIVANQVAYLRASGRDRASARDAFVKVIDGASEAYALFWPRLFGAPAPRDPGEFRSAALALFDCEWPELPA